MKHLYFLAFTVVFITGGVGAPPAVKKVIQDRLPETVYVDPLAKHSDRLEMECNG